MAHTTFPSNLPIPQDDGACSHLTGARVPSVPLFATSGDQLDVSSFSDLTIVFCYPRTGARGETITDDWNSIPGARGCTPQACSFRDQMDHLRKLGVKRVFGLSTQSTAYQNEAKDRLRLPYESLSDENLEFANTLKLPTFRWQDKTLVKRCALAIQGGTIVNVWYPVFPPDASARQVVEWLGSRK
ncbi:redoxin [Pyrenophora tritici-repentis]|uniref:Redoxin n=1 Tax=Pyrenophora tritici-repentis TaxID=45151 RepID=A0A2W1E6W4_9PLEO|nr:Redoxin family protein [Pyrenophora tritici-repentis]KAF7569178.1 redoxin [Pyrenophora tritici-repentis]KAG9383031.1 Redoxin family protein [Pyrenophora tritici-repentis]KAI0578620.1 Redoxin family protein [Pyrenophora tritici-repentis]KAI0583282.1 Redoxin family protein [Pyrenophora tritici-repentis]